VGDFRSGACQTLGGANARPFLLRAVAARRSSGNAIDSVIAKALLGLQQRLADDDVT
jgi:hypothetical protein